MKMECESEEDSYQTKDWIEAAALLSDGLALSRVIRKEGVVYFSFQSRKRALSVVERYWHDRLNGSLFQFAQNQRRIKDLIYKGFL